MTMWRLLKLKFLMQSGAGYLVSMCFKSGMMIIGYFLEQVGYNVLFGFHWSFTFSFSFSFYFDVVLYMILVLENKLPSGEQSLISSNQYYQALVNLPTHKLIEISQAFKAYPSDSNMVAKSLAAQLKLVGVFNGGIRDSNSHLPLPPLYLFNYPTQKKIYMVSGH